MFFFFWGPLFFIFPLFVILIILRLFFPRLGRRSRHKNMFNLFGNSLVEADSEAARIFQLAHKLGGRLTLSDIVVKTGMDPKQAQKFIEQMVDGVRVRMEVDERGIVYYEFPEILARLGER